MSREDPTPYDAAQPFGTETPAMLRDFQAIFGPTLQHVWADHFRKFPWPINQALPFVQYQAEIFILEFSDGRRVMLEQSESDAFIALLTPPLPPPASPRA